jgi:hypothetical protein
VPPSIDSDIGRKLEGRAAQSRYARCMCGACALAAMAGASGARSWLQAQHATWLTPRRMKVATVSLFAAATVGSSLSLTGSSLSSTHPKPHAAPHYVLR